MDAGTASGSDEAGRPATEGLPEGGRPPLTEWPHRAPHGPGRPALAGHCPTSPRPASLRLEGCGYHVPAVTQ